jgi:hypothetical protein
MFVNGYLRLEGGEEAVRGKRLLMPMGFSGGNKNVLKYTDSGCGYGCLTLYSLKTTELYT